MAISPAMRTLLRVLTGLTLAFLYVPLLVIALYAFNERRTQTWPIPGFTLEWFGKAVDNPGVRDALLTSLKAGLGATAIALVLGTMAALAVSRFDFFGRDAICVVVVYNNAVARLRRMSRSFEEASADLGADPWQTFRLVTLPQLRSALGAGGLLAFGLSFDEIIV